VFTLLVIVWFQGYRQVVTGLIFDKKGQMVVEMQPVKVDFLGSGQIRVNTVQPIILDDEGCFFDDDGEAYAATISYKHLKELRGMALTEAKAIHAMVDSVSVDHAFGVIWNE
jgi:hypothetical protein